MASSVEELSELIDQNPDSSYYWGERSEAYSSLGKHEEALADAKKAVELKPGDMELNKLLADAHMAVARTMFAKAVEAFKKARASDPSNQSLKSSLANALAYHCSPFGDALKDRDKVWSKLHENPRMSEWENDYHHFRSVMEDKINSFQGKEYFPDDYCPFTAEAKLDLDRDDASVVEAIVFLLSDHTEDYEMPVAAAVVAPGLLNRELGRGNRAFQSKLESIQKKEDGDRALSSRNFHAAVNLYTEAITLAPLDYHPFGPASYSSLGAAYHGSGVQHLRDAWKIYNKQKQTDFLEKDEHIQLGMMHGGSKVEIYTNNPLEEIFHQLSESQMFEILSCNATEDLMGQEDFISMMREVEANPRLVHLYLKDGRMIRALCVLFHPPAY